MITTLNNRNIGEIKLFKCPICLQPMKNESQCNYITFYQCNTCSDLFDKAGSISVNFDVYQKKDCIWISIMNIYFDNINIRQDNMENKSEYALTVIYSIPKEIDGTWIEIISCPMIEFDLSDIEKFKKKIKSYITFS